MDAELVTHIPSMASVYAKAVKTLGRKPRGARLSTDSLPAVTLVFQGAKAEPAALGAFRRAVGAPVNAVLPSLYVHSLAFPLAMSLMVREDFPLPLLGMIHLSNEVQVLAPLADDEHFDVQVNAENLRPHAQGTCCDLVVNIEVAGVSRMVLRSTFLAKGIWLAGSSKTTGAQAERVQYVAPQRTAQWVLDARTGRMWAGVAGDYNPIHLSKLSAKALGMPGSIAHGIYLAARALAGIEPAAGNYRWKVSFKTPVVLEAKVDLAFEAQENGYLVQAWNARKPKPHFELELRRD